MTATVVLDAAAPREQWLAARRHGVGGSDIAAILGRSRWKTPMSVWLDKTAGAEDLVGERLDMGHRIEPVLRTLFAEEHPNIDVSPSPGLLAHDDFEWAMATPDGLTYADLTPGIWEGKNVGWRSAGDWDDDVTPEEYAWQVHWYMTVTGARRAHVSALLGGNHYVERLLEADDDFSARLLSKVGAWWKQHVVDGEMPAAMEADSGLLNTLWERLDLSPTDVDDLADVLDELRAVQSTLKAVAAQEKRLKVAVKERLGAHTDGYVAGELAVTWRASKPVTRIDLDALRRDHPALAAEYAVTGNPVRSLRLKEPKKS